MPPRSPAPRPRRPRGLLTGALAAALACGACGDDDGSTATPADAAADAAAGDGGGALTLADASGPAPGPRVTTGSLPLYRMQRGKARHDASGAAFLPGLGRILLVDDGGDNPPDVVPFYTLDVKNGFALAELPHPVMSLHGDLEGATFDGTWVYVTSSLPAATEPPYEDERFRALSRFKLDERGISEVATVYPRAQILAALERDLDPATYAKVAPLQSKAGGLNVEGLAATPRPGELLVGLRSPHVGDAFPMPNPRSGDAVIVKLDARTFTAEGISAEVFAKLDLGGLGVRGMEWSPTAQGYFLTAGIVDAGYDYDFFFWKGPGAKPVRVTLPELTKLCRPEAVAEIVLDGRPHLLFLSEDSGAICEEPRAPYTYVLVELAAPFLDRLK